MLWATGTLADVVFLWATPTLRKRIGPSAMLVLGGSAAVLRWIGFALDPSLPVVFALQALHALSFTATCLAAVELTHTLAAEGTPGRQIFTWAISTGLAGGLAVLATAPLYGAIGTGGYWVMAVLAMAGLVAALCLHHSDWPRLWPMAGRICTNARLLSLADD